MGKKIPLLISTLTLCAISLAPTMVWADEGARTAWTYEEMATLNKDIEVEIEEACGKDDPMCSSSYLYNNKSGDIYRALGHYRDRGLTITAINPNNHTIRVAYDANLLSRRSSDQLTIKDLYIVQSEVGHDPGAYLEAIEEDNISALEHLKVLFAKYSADASDVWFPQDVEIVLSTPELASVDNLALADENYRLEPLDPTKYQSILNISYRASDLISAQNDQVDFSTCLESLKENMECRIMYEANRSFYAAFEVEDPIVESNDADSTESEITTLPSSTSIDNGEVSSDSAPNDSTASLALTEPATPAVTSLESSVSAPETGQNTTGNQSNANEFPWWLAAILVSGLVTLLCFFGSKIKKHQKSSKKS